MGNILIWYTATLGLLGYCALLVFYLLRRRRNCFDLPTPVFDEFVEVGNVLLTGYLVHYVPYFFYDRTLFLHHYLPAYLYSIMLSAYFYSHVLRLAGGGGRLARCARAAMVGMWLVGVVYVFARFSVLSYAHKDLTAAEVRSLRWKDTWDLIIHKK